MNDEQKIRIALLFVCKVAGSDSDFNAVAFHALCDKLKQLGAADEREVIATWLDGEAGSGRIISCTCAAKAIRARGNI
jgi:hypothetical protein